FLAFRDAPLYLGSSGNQYLIAHHQGIFQGCREVISHPVPIRIDLCGGADGDSSSGGVGHRRTGYLRWNLTHRGLILNRLRRALGRRRLDSPTGRLRSQVRLLEDDLRNIERPEALDLAAAAKFHYAGIASDKLSGILPAVF